MSSENKDHFVLLKDLRCGSRNINTKFIVLDIGQGHKTKDGNEVRTLLIADRSGSMNLSVWNDSGNYMQQGDIFKLLKGNTTVRNSSLILNVGRNGQLMKIGEFCFPFNEFPFLSDFNAQLDSKMMEINQPKKKHHSERPVHKKE